ncbi:MAG: hypothetical protein EOO68_16370, partial [Moraxellaceae bacterium]
MNMHKRIRLTPLDREEIWRLYQSRQWKVSHLADRFGTQACSLKISDTGRDADTFPLDYADVASDATGAV